ncbi:MAG: metal ABC transporter permease [Acidimicrobiales bacterium]
MNHLLDLYDSTIMQRALIEAALVGALCGAVGIHVLLRRLPFFTITVAHATFPGVVLAVILGASVLTGAVVFALLLVLGIWLTGVEERLATSTVVGVALAGSFGVGAMLQSTQNGFTKDLASILVGQIIAVQRGDLIATAIIGGLVLATMVSTHKELVLSAFDRTEAQAQGHSRTVDLLALLIVAAAVVTTVPAVGTILSVALLTIPAMTARLVTRRVETAMVTSAAIGALAGVVGLTISAQWRVAAGAAITLTAAGLFLLVLLFTTVTRRATSTEKAVVFPDAGRTPELAR